MLTDAYNKYCVQRYLEVYSAVKKTFKKKAEAERAAQKEAIKVTVIEAFEKYPKIDSSQIWQAIYAAHVNRKSGIHDPAVISAVISADNSVELQTWWTRKALFLVCSF